jgi:hypothetical protein
MYKLLMYLFSYAFIQLFLMEPLMMFCGTIGFRGALFGKHWLTDIKFAILLHIAVYL